MEPTRYDYLAEQVLLLYYGGDVPADAMFESQEVLALVKQAHGLVITKSYWDNLRAAGEHDVDGQVMFTYAAIDVTLDSTRRKYYALLPAPYVALPGGRGVQQVVYTGRPDLPELYRLATGGSMQRATRSDVLSGYWPESGKLWFRFNKKSNNAPAANQVDITLVSGGDGQSPPEQEMAVIMEVLKLMQLRGKPDKTADQRDQV